MIGRPTHRRRPAAREPGDMASQGLFAGLVPRSRREKG